MPAKPDSFQKTADRRSIRLNPIIDMRPADASLGLVAGRPFTAGDLIQWIDHELAASASKTAHALDGMHDVADLDTTTVSPRLLKAYVSSVSLAKTAVIVLQIDYTFPTGATETKIFRGQFAGANWSSTEAEVTNALKRAFANCAQKWIVDLNARLSVPKAG